MYKIDAEEVNIGQGVVIEDGVVIRGKTGKAQKVVIGDYTFIGRDSLIAVDELIMGDYVVLHNHAFVSGDKPCKIDHCCWFGQNVVLNSSDELIIGRGAGIGAYSQLWTHIAAGDTLQGCRWDKTKPLLLEEDVWFVGHCIVSPIIAREKSMALIGSVVTRDMEANHVYAGVPAQDITEKVGFQFDFVSVEEKKQRLEKLLNVFYNIHSEHTRGSIEIVSSFDEVIDDDHTVFDVSTRTYNKRLAKVEVAFMKFILPTSEGAASLQLGLDLDHNVKFYPRSA